MEVVTQQISAAPPPLREKVPNISPDVEQVVLTALAKDPLQRFARIEAFASALEHAIEPKPLSLLPSSPSNAPRSTTNSEEPAMQASLLGPQGRMPLGSTRFTIGRAQDNNLVVSDSKVSPYHAELRPEGQNYSIIDLASTNGTFVNNQQLPSGMPRLLHPGDAIRIGDTRFSFEASLPHIAGMPSNDSTILATPSSPGGGIGNPGGNTNYGGGGPNYPDMQPDYQATIPAQPAYTPNLTPNQQQSYTPSQTPYVVPGARTPINTPSSYGQHQQQAFYTPQQPPPYGPSQQPLYSPPPQQRRSSMLRNLILAVIALIIILGGLGSFFVVHNNQVAQQNADATATAVANTHAQATATANALVTATAAVNATATALVTSRFPPFTNLAFFDPLKGSTTSTQWNTSAGCQLSSGGYQVSIDRVGFVQWCNNGKQLGEMAYQATMTLSSGDCGGLVYRYIDANDFYLFEVCQNGTYNSGDFVGGKANYLYSSPKASSAIHQGTKQSNVIAVTVQGNTINMYVNGQNIDSATSNALTNSSFAQGEFGLLAYDIANPTSVTYTNATVWTAS